jgi:competence protein ComEA
LSLLDSDRVQEVLERAGLGELQPRTLKAVVLLGVVVAGFGLWRFWPSAPAPEVAFDTGVPAEKAVADESTETSAEPEPGVVVHVVGAVMRPGVYSLPPNARVTEAISAAGGGLGNAALESLNLARILVDGEQVCVLTIDQVAAGAGPPAATAGASPAASATSGAQVDINRASAAELEALPGVGPSTAQKIVDDRTANGPFKRIEDLMRVSGIGEKKFDSLKDYVSVG